MIRLTHTGATQLAMKLEKSAATDLHRALVNSTEASARRVEQDLKQRRFSGNPIKTRSGQTRASIRAHIDRGRNPWAAVGTAMKHVPVLESGKTIRAKRARLLTIPLRAALTRGGRSRGDARSVGAMFDRTFWRTSKRGAVILWGVRGKRMVPLFVGKRSVRIPARWAFRTAHQATRVGVVRIYEQSVERTLR